jgi:hypothetical protein
MKVPTRVPLTPETVTELLLTTPGLTTAQIVRHFLPEDSDETAFHRLRRVLWHLLSRQAKNGVLRSRKYLAWSGERRPIHLEWYHHSADVPPDYLSPDAVLDAITRMGQATTREILTAEGLDETTVLRAVRKLSAEGIIKDIGDVHWPCWTLASSNAVFVRPAGRLDHLACRKAPIKTRLPGPALPPPAPEPPRPITKRPRFKDLNIPLPTPPSPPPYMSPIRAAALGLIPRVPPRS